MDTKQLIDLLTRNPAAGAAVGGLAGSVLGNVLTGRGGGLGKTTVKYGGLAAIGYVAYQAWQKYQAAKAPGQAGAGGGGMAVPSVQQPAALPASFDLESNASDALRVIQAMIAASKADGMVEASERDRIFAKVNETGLSQGDQDQVLQLLTQPLDLESVVRGVGTPELATEIYAASLLAVSPANRAERAYLDMLAARLGLESSLTMQIEQAVEALPPR